MRRPPHLLFLVLFVSLALQACGSDQNRPVIVATVPAQGASLGVSVYEVRFTFDDPVSILNSSQIAVDSGGVGIPLVTRVDPDDNTSILVAPAPGAYWRVGDNRVKLRAGFEVNDQGHYRLEDYTLHFQLGVDVPMFLGVPSPASVVEVDGLAFDPLGTVPTPGARVPKGLACSSAAPGIRAWVQLESGGGTAEALAFFGSRALTMETVELTHEPGGDLETSYPAIETTPEHVYVAYRDTALGQVRLHEVDVATGNETRTVVLSPAASPGTTPHGLSVALNGLTVDVVCAADAGARLARVDLETFVEVDLGPDVGVDGIPLPAGPGPARTDQILTFVVPRSATEADLTKADPTNGDATTFASAILGSPYALVRTPDGRWTVSGLSGFVDQEALSYRRIGELLAEEPILVDEDTGAGNGVASTVLDVIWFTGTNYLVALLDNDAAAVLDFTSNPMRQVDLNELTAESAIDLSGVAPGATLVAVPPPAR